MYNYIIFLPIFDSFELHELTHDLSESTGLFTLNSNTFFFLPVSSGQYGSTSLRYFLIEHLRPSTP